MKKHILFFCWLALVLFFIPGESRAQNPSLVADVNSIAGVPEALPGFAVSNGILYYFGGTTVKGLWRSDGTQQGTYLVKNLSATFNPLDDLTDVNGTLYFAAVQDGNGFGTELWKSDGTEEGTVMVKDIEPGSSSSYPSRLNNINGTLYFTAFRTGFGTELWKSNGTAAGTVLVKDLSPGPFTTTFGPEMFPYQGKVLFGVLSDAGHNQLWISDGSGGGTKMLKDFGSMIYGFSFIYNFNELNGAVYFIVNAENSGLSLCKTDGTVSGTKIITSLTGGCTNCTGSWQLRKAGNVLVMQARDDVHGMELWVSDGTVAGTMLLKDINPGSASSNPDNLSVIGNTVYFSATDPAHGREIWKTDGSASGTVLFLDYLPGPSSYTDEDHFINTNGKILFTIPNPFDDDLYSTDGTVAGTVELGDGSMSSLLSFLQYDGDVYFGEEILSTVYGPLQRTDGTIAGTGPVPYTVSQTNSSNPQSMVKFPGGGYLFDTDDGIHGNELWITNGTPGGTSLLKDINQGITSTVYSFGPELNNKLLFAASTPDGDVGKEQTLWITDGTESGTQQISLCNPAPNTSGVFNYTKLDNIVYFIGSLSGDITHYSLWRSDGTTAGTYPVKEVFSLNVFGNLFGELTTFNDKIYFTGYDANHGYELWKSDGTSNGTLLFKDIAPGTMNSDPLGFTVFQGTLYFFATTSAGGRDDLWKSDGTVAGTRKVAKLDFQEGPIITAGAYFYFTSGPDMWRSDGTNAGTFIIRNDVTSTGRDPAADVNGTFFFIDQTSFTGDELWKSDGTLAGTVFIKTVGFPSWEETDFINVNGDLYFSSFSNGISFEQALWRSDGTECHTVALDLLPGKEDEANILASDGATIFLSLNSATYGVEPFQFITSPITNTETCNGLDDDCNGVTDDNPVATITPSGTLEICKGIPVTFTTDPGINNTFQWSKNGNTIAGAEKNSFTAGLNTSGNYAVLVKGTNGCEALSDATTLNRLPLPVATITPLGNLDICTTGSVDLQANSGVGYTWQWNKNNHPISNATNQTYHATSVGSYKVMVTNGSGCDKSSQKVTVVNSCKEGFSQHSISLKLFPNPVADELKIQFEGDLTGKLVITNLHGQVIFSGEITASGIVVNAAAFAGGIYFVRLETENGIAVKSFVKE